MQLLSVSRRNSQSNDLIVIDLLNDIGISRGGVIVIVIILVVVRLLLLLALIVEWNTVEVHAILGRHDVEQSVVRRDYGEEVVGDVLVDLVESGCSARREVGRRRGQGEEARVNFSGETIVEGDDIFVGGV